MTQVIRNVEKLASTPERVDALAIAEAGYAGVNTEQVIRRKVLIEGDQLVVLDKRYPLASRRVFYLGVGKCALVASKAIEELLGDRLTAGIAFAPVPLEGHESKKIETHIGTHPEPSEANIRATERIISFLSDCQKEDLILMLISGGGSTLLCSPETPMTCVDEQMLFDDLTARGASIQDLNLVRKHISKARGGGLAFAAYPAEVVSLIMSDVPGNDVHTIASGPTVLDTSTVDDAKAVLSRYSIEPSASITFIETPKDEKYFERVTNTLLVTNRDALHAMQAEAEVRGYRTEIVDDCFTGEASDVGRLVVEKLHAAPAHSALLYAGESTVTLGEPHREGGQVPRKGGRNQELALAALADLHDGEIVLPFASDGHDNSDHAGAIADTLTREHANAQELSAENNLAAHTSYTFFTATGDFLETGYTGSNVSDLIIALKK